MNDHDYFHLQRFIQETSAMLQTPTTPEGESWNTAVQQTPGVIGAQEVYRFVPFVKRFLFNSPPLWVGLWLDTHNQMSILQRSTNASIARETTETATRKIWRWSTREIVIQRENENVCTGIGGKSNAKGQVENIPCSKRY